MKMPLAIFDEESITYRRGSIRNLLILRTGNFHPDRLLALRNIDVLPAEEPGIDRPGTRSEHGQSGGKGRQHDGNPWITGARENDTRLNNGYHRSNHWGPQTDEEKCPRTSCNDLRGD